MLNFAGNINVFKNVALRGGYEITSFNTSVSNKNEDGTYSNASIEVRFVGSEIEEGFTAGLETDTRYNMDVEGFLSFREYEDQEGNRRVIFVLLVTTAEIVDEIPVGKAKPTKPAKPQPKKPAKKSK